MKNNPTIAEPGKNVNQEDALYPCSFVIFGATGHLAATKLLPALYRLEMAKRLPAGPKFCGFARREWENSARAPPQREAPRRNLRGPVHAGTFCPVTPRLAL